MEWFIEGMERCCGPDSASQASTLLFDNGFECARIGYGGETRHLAARNLMQAPLSDLIFRRPARRVFAETGLAVRRLMLHGRARGKPALRWAQA